MLWTIAAVGTLGLFLGLRYKVTALIPASGGLTLLIAALAVRSGWNLGAAVFAIFATLLTVQIMYAVGLLLAGSTHCTWRRPPRQD